MKKGILTTVAVTVILIIAAFICRASFTHYDSLEPFRVTLINDDIVEMVKNSVKKAIGESSNIVKVKCTSEVILSDSYMRQRAKVVHVYDGSDVTEGEEIYISPYSSCIFEDYMSINMGFTNAMTPDEEYLVFLESPVKLVDDDYSVYRTTESIMSMIFSFTDHENIVPDAQEVDEIYTVEYSAVENNEFFVSSKEIDDEMKILKADIMEKFQD